MVLVIITCRMGHGGRRGRAVAGGRARNSASTGAARRAGAGWRVLSAHAHACTPRSACVCELGAAGRATQGVRCQAGRTLGHALSPSRAVLLVVTDTPSGPCTDAAAAPETAASTPHRPAGRASNSVCACVGLATSPARWGGEISSGAARAAPPSTRRAPRAAPSSSRLRIPPMHPWCHYYLARGRITTARGQALGLARFWAGERRG